MLAALLFVAATGWVPARWTNPDPHSLELLDGTPINCLLMERVTAEFVRAAEARGVAVLRVLDASANTEAAFQEIVVAKPSGIVLEGSPGVEIQGRARELAASQGWRLIEILPRAKLRLDVRSRIVATNQGLWPGIRLFEGGAAQAAPTGGPWVETNAGFLRYLRAATDAEIWMANTPPPKTIIRLQGYQRAIADAATAGARWVVALDADFDRRLHARDREALADWRRIGTYLRFYEDHAEWRNWRPAGGVALIQDEQSGALLSGGILDMIAVKHVPVRPIPRPRLSPELLRGLRLVINVDPASLSAADKEVLRGFTRAGGTLLSGPPGWKFPPPREDTVRLDEKDVARLDEIWREVNSVLGRRNFGARLFNVAGMVSDLLASPDGKQLLLHLVNYTDYPAENITVHVAGRCSNARLLEPGAPPRALSPYEIEEGVAVEIERVATAAALLLDCMP